MEDNRKVKLVPNRYHNDLRRNINCLAEVVRLLAHLGDHCLDGSLGRLGTFFHNVLVLIAEKL